VVNLCYCQLICEEQGIRCYSDHPQTHLFPNPNLKLMLDPDVHAHNHTHSQTISPPRAKSYIFNSELLESVHGSWSGFKEWWGLNFIDHWLANDILYIVCKKPWFPLSKGHQCGGCFTNTNLFMNVIEYSIPCCHVQLVPSFSSWRNRINEFWPFVHFAHHCLLPLVSASLHPQNCFERSLSRK